MLHVAEQNVEPITHIRTLGGEYTAQAPSSLCRVRQGQRSLPVNVSPTSWSTRVRVAEPDVPVKWLSLVGSFQPDLRGNHSGIAPNADGLIGIFLVLVLDPPCASHLKQVGLGVDLAGASYHNEIVSQYSVHCGSVVIFDGHLVLGVKSRDCFRVICRVAAGNKRYESQK